MKKTLTVVLAAALILSLAACAAKAPEPAQEQQTTPDADWTLPETIEMTEEAGSLFDKATETLTGAVFEPLGLLGEKDGVYCVLCRARAAYPEAKPYYSLVYVSEEGVKNIWDIWMGAHAEKKQ